ncbi:cell envelope biogenesis protein TolA, partial [Klebsiella oxytoca]|nr:cell envelope biogenesis protein TolA [Klebsiella oxytoca]MDM4120640.1 cell envelope biogenesis protein TolA [Klebsiella oxytoca]MDM4132468.1 cell envelope biogenesis protein TolA [Klebsiella oxytoca]MDM4138370.1 cell envelope biogenesis protein TolA [Klebsiella oxytoca]MDM4175444.1 cell envelope biogenesis protein TolA [Klebsiella oxytoca]
SESEATRKQLAEAASQLAALRKQNELSAASQKKELSSLGQENARLLSESEATHKQLAEAANKLASLEKSSQQSAILKTNLLKTPEGKNSYSLGVFYYDKINAEFEKITKNNIKLAPSLMIDGMNDAFNKSLKINKSEIMENVVKIDRIVQSINSDYAKKILKLINKKKYEVLANGSFLVTDKSTSKKYSANEIVTFDMLEKNLNGKPILNTMNTNVNFNQIRDPLLRKVVSEGGKGGAMTLYGKADILYKNVPDGVSPESLVSITFMLK